MADNQLAVEIRENTGKGVARKLRAQGQIPGVFYAAGETSTPVSLNARALDRLITSSSAGMNTLIDLASSGALNGKVVLVKELQRDPVKGSLLHADLYAVDLQKSIQVSVPIHLVGIAEGTKFGGIVDHALREIDLECLPNAIPEELPVDIASLEVGQSLHVRDIALPEGVTLLSDGELSVVSVALAAAEEEPTVADEEALEGEAAAEGAEGAAAKDAAAEGAGEGESKDD